jgi:uncharacterized protein (DUF433 family)
MYELPASPYVEPRGLGYYIAGTRISLDSIAYAVQRGESVGEILSGFPALSSREKLEGAIAFIQAHPLEIESYLAEGERIWKELQSQNPPEIVERIRRFDEERCHKTI